MTRFILIALLLFCMAPLSIASAQTVEITADGSFEWDREAKTYTVVDKAKVVHLDYTLTANKITAHYTENSESKINIEKIIATGNVRLQAKGDVATSNRAEYFPKKEVATLNGNVHIISDKNELFGERATLNLKTQVATISAPSNKSKRIRGIFYVDDNAVLDD